MNDESGQSMEPMEEMLLVGLSNDFWGQVSGRRANALQSNYHASSSAVNVARRHATISALQYPPIKTMSERYELSSVDVYCIAVSRTMYSPAPGSLCCIVSLTMHWILDRTFITGRSFNNVISSTVCLDLRTKRNQSRAVLRCIVLTTSNVYCFLKARQSMLLMHWDSDFRVLEWQMICAK